LPRRERVKKEEEEEEEEKDGYRLWMDGAEMMRRG
jgi:hypothetical protein